MLKYKVAGYIRLSKEDKIKDESNSVTNQKLIITSYVAKSEDLELFDFYIDDGYSGTTFDRPEYRRMFKDIVDGQVDTVIVKDLSRFGRNHIQSDDYIENTLIENLVKNTKNTSIDIIKYKMVIVKQNYQNKF